MDLRIEYIFNEEMKGDTSFQEKESGLSLFFGGISYNKHEMRKTWESGIKHGIEIGLRKASLEGQRNELNHNTKESKHKEYLEKFYKLSEEYGCAVQYHQEIGIVVVSRKNGL